MNKKMRTATIQTCNYRECSNAYKRYAYQIKKGTGLYCSQSCAAKEMHASTDKPEVKILKPCKFCGEKEKYRRSGYCRKCYNVYSSGKLYGITIDKYYEMLEQQNGLCGICKLDKCSTGKNFCIDHDHETGKVRGLLCYSCNVRLGWYEKKIGSIEKYLASEALR